MSGVFHSFTCAGEVSMCTFGGQILFCTCSNLSDENSSQENSADNKNTGLYWQLLSVRNKDIDVFEMETGRSVIPSESIHDLQATDILFQLNQSLCFDFDYQPQDNDYLLITETMPHLEDYSHQFPYVCFVFDKNIWKLATFDEFNTVLTGINKGRLSRVLSI